MKAREIILFFLLITISIKSETNNYFGDAVDVKSGQKVYSDNHSELVVNGKHTSSQIEYKDAGGKVIGKKSIKFNSNSYLPDFKLEDFRDGYIEGGEIVDGKYRMFYKKNKNEQLQEKIMDIAPYSVADGGFDPFIKDNWNDLMAGKKIKFKFYAPSQLDSFNFYVTKTKTAEYAGRSSLFVKMEMDNLLLNIFIPPILITYDIATKRIVFYEGISNINNSQGKSYTVKLTYNHFK
jgi:hypothetical protein